MPGSKRRALKNLLSPSSSGSNSPSKSQNLTSPASAPIDPMESGTFLASQTSQMTTSSTASNPANYLSDEQLKEDLEVEAQMDGQNGLKGGLPPADVPPPRPQIEIPTQGSTSATSAFPPNSVISPSPGDIGEGGGDSKGHRHSFGEKMAGMAGHLGLSPGGGSNGAGVGGGKKKSSRQKHEERMAKKKQQLLDSAPPPDPHWDAKLEKERQEEISVISDACQVLDREIYEITPDGHCMFHAVAHQLAEIGIIPADQANNPSFTRKAAAEYMLAHQDDFIYYLPSVDGEDMEGATTRDGILSQTEYRKYCSNVAETGEWGGEPEIQALSRAFKVPIHVIQRGPPTVVSHGGPDDTFGGALTPEQSKSQGDKVVRISYHRRMYGLGEHYNSLKKA